MTRSGNIRALALLAALTALTACSSSNPSAPKATPSAAPAHVLVTVGDSIPFNSTDDCPGCTGFVDAVAAELESTSGRAVTVRNLSRHDSAKTQDIVSQLETDRALVDLLPTANVVIASFGFNDQPPYTGADASCPSVSESDDDETVFSALTKTSTGCIDAQTATLGASARALLTRLRSLAPDASIAVLNSYNAWIGWSVLDTNFPDLRDGIAATTSYALDRWNEVVCAEAESIDATCVDIYHRVNGDDGRAPAGSLLAMDYTHPSQAGNDAIAEVLTLSGVLPTAPD